MIDNRDFTLIKGDREEILSAVHLMGKDYVIIKNVFD